MSEDITGRALAEAAGAFVRDVAPNVSALWDAAEDVLRADAPEGVTSTAEAAGVAVAVAEAAARAAEAVAADMLAATFPAVADYVADACGLPRGSVWLSWSDTAEDVGYVLPVSAYVDGGTVGYQDAWAVVDAWDEPAWPDVLAGFVTLAVAEARAAV